MTDFVVGDTASKLEVTCTDNETGLVINLSGATVKLQWLAVDGTTEVNKTMTITDAGNGVAEYLFLVTELYAGVMIFEVEITDAGGGVITNLIPIKRMVRARIVA